MPFRDLRAFLADLDDRGDLRTLSDPVEPRFELGAIARLACETYGPAVLFDSLVGHPEFRATAAFQSYSSDADHPMSRIARSFGLPADSKGYQIVDHLSRIDAADSVPPTLVKDAPVQEHIVRDRDGLLDYLPVPHLHPGDGGPYVNTIGFFVMESPDRDWVNWSVARAMKLDGNRFVGMTANNQHIGMLREKWDAIRDTIPFALVLGADPVTTFIAGSPVAKFGESEVGVIGGLLGQALEVVECVTSPLRVPAHAEIVIEGYLDLTESANEGPMAEYHGYIDRLTNTQGAPTFGVYHVTAVTHRTNAIYPSVAAGKPVDEDHTLTGPGIAAVCLRAYRAAGLPVAKAWMVHESANHLLALTLTDDWATKHPDSAELFEQIVHTTKGLTHEAYWVQRILVTNDDIDPTSTSDLWWAYATRSRPGDGSTVFEGVPIMPLSPMVNTVEERLKGIGRIELLNCLIPPEVDEMSPTSAALRESYSAELVELARSRYLGSAE